MTSRVSLKRFDETNERDNRLVYGAYSRKEVVIMVLNETWKETEWHMYAAQFKKPKNDPRWIIYPVLDVGICDYDKWSNLFEFTNRADIESYALDMVHETEIFTQRYSRFAAFGKYTFAVPSPDGWLWNFDRWYHDVMVKIDDRILSTTTQL